MRINILLPSKGAELLALIWLPGFVPGYCPKSDGTGSLRHHTDQVNLLQAVGRTLNKRGTKPEEKYILALNLTMFERIHRKREN